MLQRGHGSLCLLGLGAPDQSLNGALETVFPMANLGMWGTWGTWALQSQKQRAGAEMAFLPLSLYVLAPV